MNRKTVKIDDNVNFTYHYWMRKYFNLEGVELTVYAIVYNVSCIQDSRLYAGAKYIAELIGSSERTVYRALSSLCEKNLIIKNIEKLKSMEWTSYTTNIDKIVEMRSKSINTVKMAVPMPNETKNGENITHNNCQNGSSPTVKMADNNHSNNNQNNNINSEINLSSSNSKNNLKKEEKEYISESNDSSIYLEKEKKKRFEKPTFEEVEAYIREQNYDIDPHTFFDYYEACGWTVGKNKPMKDWKASVRYWVSSRKNNGDTSKPVKEEHQFNVRQYFPGDEDKIPF